jgi:outer membrane protein OmpA-like peptidoglycan-associated protein
VVRALKYLFFLFFTLAVYSWAGAQNAEVEDLGSSFARTSAPALTHEVTIGFANNSSRIDASYGQNSVAMQEIEEFMRVLLKGECGTRAIIIDGAASPLGNEEYNKRLALRRAEAVRDFLHTIEGSDSIKIHAISNGEDWESFTHSVLEGYNRPNRDKVIEIIRSNRSHDEKEAMFRQIDKSGETFRVLVSQHMASARNAAVIRIIEIADLTLNIPQPSFDAEISSPVLEKMEKIEQPVTEPVEPLPAPTTERKPVVALRSNLLVPALNVGVEVPIGTHWSVGADYYYPWIWPKSDNKDCFEFLGWGVEARYWFGKNRTVMDRLQGHSIGLYGYMGYYDFERNYQGYQGEFVNIGLDYTYAMAVGKKRAVHFEFSLGVGYIYSQARKYTVIEPGSPLISDKRTKKVGFFGPTKANISLVVPIFQKVKPNDKEAKR